jgi:hypothetical protein
MMSSHSLMLSNLTPNTLYHFQIISTNSASSTTYSSDQTFTTAMGSTTAATTTAPMISSILATPQVGGMGATITWNSDQPGTTQVQYGTSPGTYTSSTTQDTNLMTSHSVTLSGLTPNTTYFFRVMSINDSGMNTTAPGQLFMTSMSTTTSTSTPSQSDWDALKARIQSLEQQLAALIQQFNLFMMNGNGGNGGNGGTGTTTPPVVYTGTISPATQSVMSGNSIDFGGRGFGREETVNIMRNGVSVGSAHADGGGNFSTGSMSVPTTAGTYTYTFTGGYSGISGSSTITVQ